MCVLAHTCVRERGEQMVRWHLAWEIVNFHHKMSRSDFTGIPHHKCKRIGGRHKEQEGREDEGGIFSFKTNFGCVYESLKQLIYILNISACYSNWLARRQSTLNHHNTSVHYVCACVCEREERKIVKWHHSREWQPILGPKMLKKCLHKNYTSLGHNKRREGGKERIQQQQ